MTDAREELEALFEADPVQAMDRATAKRIHHEADDLMKALAEDLGMAHSPKNCSFATDTFTYRCEFKLKTVGGVPAEEAAFKRECYLFDLEPGDFGAVVTIRGEQWRLTGLQPNRPKFPLVFTRVSDGKQLLYTDDQVAKVKAARRAPAQPPPADL